MRKSCYFIIFLFSLIFTACTSQSEYEPKWPPIRVERPEISFEMLQPSDGVMKVRMTNNGNAPFRYYEGILVPSGGKGGFPVFRMCKPTHAECSGTEWRNPNEKVSHAILIPTELSELEPGGSVTYLIGIQSMLSLGGVFDPKPGDRLQIKLRVMLTEYFEEYVEFVSDWMLVETLMPL